MSNKAARAIVGVAIGAIGAIAAIGTVKYIEHEQKQIEQRKKEQTSDVKLCYDPTQTTAISILSHHGKFINCIKNKVNCTATKRGNEQTLISIPIQSQSDNQDNTHFYVALKTFNGKYLSAQPKNGVIECNRDQIGKWETFQVEKFTNKKDGSDLWAFKSFHGYYVSAEWFTGLLYANRAHVKSWEKFSVQIVDYDDDWE
mmetsp:Transcript_30430/g.49528  ORF Transcript_30430/g.49528 Transcript_30430/m.49528 type:complete len:200 (+) Transcript_30430:35-634(+)